MKSQNFGEESTLKIIQAPITHTIRLKPTLDFMIQTIYKHDMYDGLELDFQFQLKDCRTMVLLPMAILL